jgi:5-methylcytosine-specific restriction endonuclease McrA
MALSAEERKARKNAARNLKYATDPEYARKEKEKSAAYRKLNPEKVSELKKRCRLKKLEEYKEKRKIYYWKNPEILRAKSRAYALENKETLKEKNKIYREKNKARLSQRTKLYTDEQKAAASKRACQWAKKYPEKVQIRGNNRRARKKLAAGKPSKDIYDKLMILQKGTCVCCRVSLKDVKVHIDHIVPLSKGGTNDDLNMQLLCQTCNNRKHAKHPIDFMQENGYLL